MGSARLAGVTAIEDSVSTVNVPLLTFIPLVFTTIAPVVAPAGTGTVI
jgi:hypothetical protein